MSTFRFTGQRLDDKLVASISRLLNAARIPNVLWGNYLLTVYGVPTIVDGVAFAVPDALVDDSLSTLRKAGFPPCTQSFDCPHSNSRRRPPPTTHLHIDDDLAISLYRKSDVLWEFPNFELTLNDKNTHIMSASDTRLPAACLGRGRGRFSSDLGSVQIPSATRYCEALILLLCRDYGSIYEGFWMVMLTYIVEFVDGTDVLDEKSLGEEYIPFYHALEQGDFSKMYLLLDELRRHFMRKRLFSDK